MKILNVIQPVRTHLQHLAFAVAGAGVLTGSAQAEMIVNVQFYVTGTTASMTDIQGPVASATTTPYWNQFTGTNFNANISGYPGPDVLNMADGTASNISLSMVGTWHPDGTNRGAGQIPVFWGVAFMENSTETQTAAFSGLKTDGTTYALYALGSVVPTADTRLTLGTGTPVGATPTAIRLRGAVKGFSLTYDSTMNLTQWVTTSTDAAGDDFASTANTAYFPELLPDASGNLSVVVSYANDHRWNDGYPKPFAGVAGYQLVEISLPPATTPVITAGGSPLAALSTTYGTASTETSFTVSGTDMLEGILVTPPAGFEVSQTTGSGFAATTTVGGVGPIATTTVYVRLTATAAATGSYNGQDIRLTSSFALPVNVITAASGNTVTPKPLTVTATGPVTKAYGTTLTAGTSTTNFTATGEVNGELVTSVTLMPDAAGASPTTATGASYVITPAAATGSGGFLESNYNITYTPYSAGVVVIGTPVLSVTNSPVFYDGSSHAALVSASVPGGTPTDVRYNGAADVPTAVGTYAVTANFVPTDTTNYTTLNDAAAGDFVIAPAIVLTFDPDLVLVGDAGNTADYSGFGAVAYDYQIGKYEVTNDQYAAFLNAVAKTDQYALYILQMGDSARSGITRTGDAGNYTYTVKTNMGNKPVCFVNWGNAARLANWLHNGQPTTGVEDATTTELGAYALNGATSANALGPMARETNAKYWIPSEDEWYKAAYYQGGGTTAGYWAFTTNSNAGPWPVTATATGDGVVPDEAKALGNSANFFRSADWNGMDGNVTTVGTNGGPSAYGTYDQGGNIWEWNDSGGFGDGFWWRGVRGDLWNANNEQSTDSSRGGGKYILSRDDGVGFRVAGAASTSAGNDYTSWASTNSVTGGVRGDSNHDGVPNGIAYFMGLTGPLTNPGLDASNMVTWPMSASFLGTYEVQTSSDLDTWNRADPQPTRNVDGNLVYSLPFGLGKQFVRLVVTPN